MGAVATNPKPASPLATLNGLLEKYKSQIAMALPKHLTPERMIRVALTAVSTTPKLMECDPMTIAACVVQASILGLEPNAALGECYLVPFKNNKRGGRMEAQLMIGYQGLIKLARNSGELVMIDAQPVRQNDEFYCEHGLEPTLRHRHAEGDRGPVVRYWAGAVLKGGGKQFATMTVAEIEAHRDKYSKGAYYNGKLTGAWAESPDWMYRKTVIRQLAKLLPKSVEAQMAIALDERAEAGLQQRFSVDVPLELQPAVIEDEPDAAPVDMPKRASETTVKVEPAEPNIEAPAPEPLPAKTSKAQYADVKDMPEPPLSAEEKPEASKGGRK